MAVVDVHPHHAGGRRGEVGDQRAGGVEVGRDERADGELAPALPRGAVAGDRAVALDHADRVGKRQEPVEERRAVPAQRPCVEGADRSGVTVRGGAGAAVGRPENGPALVVTVAIARKPRRS